MTTPITPIQFTHVNLICSLSHFGTTQACPKRHYEVDEALHWKCAMAMAVTAYHEYTIANEFIYGSNSLLDSS